MNTPAQNTTLPDATAQIAPPWEGTAAELIRIESVDDIPVLFATAQRLQLAGLLDRHFHNHAHHLWRGELTVGEVVSVWLTFLLSQGDHRLSRVQPWIEDHHHTLQALLGKTIRPLDFQDDRLADILSSLAQPDAWQAFETDLNQHSVRVYDLKVDRVRLDSTTASSYAKVLSEQGLIQFGHSKDRDDLPQLKVAAAALDPLGMPLTCLAVSGNSADDPLYIPEIRKVQQAFVQPGKLFVGDCKMAALATRAYVAATRDHYLCPLPLTVLSRQDRQRLLEPVWQGRQALQEVRRPAAAPGQPAELVAVGFSFDVRLRAEVDGKWFHWTERRWLVRSLALANSQEQQLEQRLRRAQEQLAELPVRKQGKKRLTAPQMQAAAEAILAEQRLQGLLEARVETTTRPWTRRRYRGRAKQVVSEQEHQVVVARCPEVIEQAKRQMGWQVYATNRLALPLRGVVWGYRGQYRLEDDWARLKGRPLSLTPMYLADAQRIQGLVLFLSLALRVLTLLEGVARKKLQEKGETLKGLYPGQPGRQTKSPSAELLLQAFRGLRLTVIKAVGQVAVLLTPLNALQKRLLALWDLPSEWFHRLTLHFADPPPILGER